jgi:hypothetical protein
MQQEESRENYSARSKTHQSSKVKKKRENSPCGIFKA